MLLMPDPASAVTDPVCAVPTLTLTCNVIDPITREPYSRDPRYIGQKAEAYLKQTGIADVSYWGPEAEFFVFDSVRFEQQQNFGYYFIDSDEGIWNSGKDGGTPNLAHRPRWKEGYFPVAPADQLQDFRSEVILKLAEAGVPVEVHHHEVATAGQCEIDMRFTSLVDMADHLLMYKYVIKNIAKAQGKTATFMPKPLWGDNGSGMHVHQSLWKDGKTLMHDPDGYAGLSQTAKYYIGGLLKHAPALLAITSPTVNSYHRLVPGFEAPVNLVYSRRNRSSRCASRCIRIIPKRSGLSSAALIRPAIPISPSRRCCWRASTASRKRSIRVSRLITTSSSTRMVTRSGKCLAHCPKRWPRSKPITNSCSRAMSLRRT